GLYGPFAFAVGLHQFRSPEEAEPLPRDPRLSANRGARMFPASTAMTMAGPVKRRRYFKTHAATQAATSTFFHPFLSPTNGTPPEIPSLDRKHAHCIRRRSSVGGYRSD